jgi:HPt (histidine-containing phosphotransfer) domain-containing protein
MKPPDKLSGEIDHLWHKYLPVMRSRIETIQLAVDAIRGNRLTPDLRADAKQSAHNLAGSLGTFGLEHASSDALEIEWRLAEPMGADGIVALDEQLARVKQAIETREGTKP